MSYAITAVVCYAAGFLTAYLVVCWTVVMRHWGE